MLTQKINTRKDISKHTVSAEILKRYFFFFSFIFITWRLITLQHCSDFCHTLT